MRKTLLFLRRAKNLYAKTITASQILGAMATLAYRRTNKCALK